MRTAIQHFEGTNEELTAANEEVTSINEELQATNEELESSKEELQSVNEELTTVNTQLDRKIGELAEASDDLQNLLIGNDVASIFLDTEMRIKWFSPGIQALFNVIVKDIGRPITDFSQRFAGGNLVEYAQAAVSRLAKSEQEVIAGDGRCYLLRVLPYRTRDNRIAGAAATFIDITELKTTQANTIAARDYAEAIVQTVRDPLLVLSADLRARSANKAFYAKFDLTAEETTGKLIYDLGRGEWNIPPLRALFEEGLSAQHQIVDFEVELVAVDSGPGHYFLLNARRIDASDGRPALILLAIEDISHRKESARHRDMLIAELSHRVKNMLTVVQSIATQTRRHSGSPEAFDEAFEGRLQALGRANDAVINGGLNGVGLAEIIEQALGPFRSAGQVVVRDGPEIGLRPQASLALAMILHEMATNAVKYGALSVPAGQVAVSWTLESGEEQRVAIEWIESGGPRVSAPTRRGQGTRFIERSIAYDLRGKANIAFEREGVKVMLSLPLAAVTSSGVAPTIPPEPKA